MHEHRPIATGFFPVARLGVGIGLVVGLLGFAIDKMRPAPAPQIVARVETASAPTPPEPAPPSTEQLPEDEWPRGELAGPSTTWPVPLRGPLVAHVWLEGCRDCMPAFEAWKRIKEMGSIDDLSQIHVAYGRASDEFVREYGVGHRLVYDTDGSAGVRPFNVG